MSAAPFANLFLILVAIVLIPAKAGVGFLLLNPVPLQAKPLECWEEGYLVASLLNDRSTSLNGVRMQRSELLQQVRTKLQHRVQRVLFFDAESTLTFAEVASFLDDCRQALPGLPVAVFPASIQKERWCPSSYPHNQAEAMQR